MEMITLKKKVNGKTFKTDFVFDDRHIKLVEDVLECLKGKTFDVPDPSKKWEPPWKSPKLLNDAERVYHRLQIWEIPKGYQWQKLSLTELGLIQIPILEWLPIVCKKVFFDNTYGRYYSLIANPITYAFDMWENKDKVRRHIALKKQDNEYLKSINLFTDYHHSNMVAGEITLARELRQNKDAFRVVLAHEINHAIDNLEIVYPSITNWEGFCDNILELNTHTADDFSGFLFKKTMPDGVYRFDILEDYFGDSARTWYKGHEKFVETMDSFESSDKRMAHIRKKKERNRI